MTVRVAVLYKYPVNGHYHLAFHFTQVTFRLQPFAIGYSPVEHATRLGYSPVEHVTRFYWVLAHFTLS